MNYEPTIAVAKGTSETNGLFPPIVCGSYDNGCQPIVQSVAFTSSQVAITVSIPGDTTFVATINFPQIS
jgi:hypothetical protein